MEIQKLSERIRSGILKMCYDLQQQKGSKYGYTDLLPSDLIQATGKLD